jgi:hypothetical protein
MIEKSRHTSTIPMSRSIACWKKRPPGIRQTLAQTFSASGSPISRSTNYPSALPQASTRWEPEGATGSFCSCPPRRITQILRPQSSSGYAARSPSAAYAGVPEEAAGLSPSLGG